MDTYRYYTMEDKIKSLKKAFNVEFKNLRACHHQTNNNTYAYTNITTDYMYIYDGYINSWIEDKNDLYNYTMYGFEDKNYELQ